MSVKTFFAPLAIALIFLSACELEPISIEVFPAALAQQQDPVSSGWRLVEFGGSVRSPSGTYLVSPDRLLSDWNITAFRASPQPDGSIAVNARLNAYARQKMASFTADAANLKQPVAININGRWADFLPILGPVGDRMTLYGLTDDEAQSLQHQIETR